MTSMCVINQCHTAMNREFFLDFLAKFHGSQILFTIGRVYDIDQLVLHQLLNNFYAVSLGQSAENSINKHAVSMRCKFKFKGKEKT